MVELLWFGLGIVFGLLLAGALVLGEAIGERRKAGVQGKLKPGSQLPAASGCPPMPPVKETLLPEECVVAGCKGWRFDGHRFCFDHWCSAVHPVKSAHQEDPAPLVAVPNCGHAGCVERGPTRPLPGMTWFCDEHRCHGGGCLREAKHGFIGSNGPVYCDECIKRCAAAK